VRRATFAEQPALLAAATVAVNPRIRSAGIPQKLLNYMAAGLPIVSFEGSAVPLRHEVSGLCGAGRRYGRDGRRDRAGASPTALARTLGDAARPRSGEFSWEQMAARVEQVYLTPSRGRANRPPALGWGGRRNGAPRRAEPLEDGGHEVGGASWSGRLRPGGIPGLGDEPATGVGCLSGRRPASGPGGSESRRTGRRPRPGTPTPGPVDPTARPDRADSGGAARWGDQLVHL
jgi:hypothetical protein